MISRSVPQSIVEVDENVLFLGKRKQFLETLLSPKAGLLVTAERRAERMPADVVDPANAGFDTRRETVRFRDVACPHRAGQPVIELIDLSQHVGLIAPT